MVKATAKVVAERVDEILHLRLLGALPSDLCGHATEAGWNVSNRQLLRYVHRADELLADSIERNRDKLMAHHYAARRTLFARCMAVSDYSTALRCLDSEATLLALFPDRRVEVNGKVGILTLTITEEIVKHVNGNEPTAIENHVNDAATIESCAESTPAPSAERLLP